MGGLRASLDQRKASPNPSKGGEIFPRPFGASLGGAFPNLKAELKLFGSSDIWTHDGLEPGTPNGNVPVLQKHAINY